MKKYSMTCTCGDVMGVDANGREEAVTKMKEMMTEKAIGEHCAAKHPGQPVMTVADVHAHIDAMLQEVPAVA